MTLLPIGELPTGETTNAPPVIPPTATGGQRALRILLVEDEPLIMAGIGMLLSTDPGIDVVARATDGGQAVEYARRVRPDVVVMDLWMPDVGGVEATRQITSDGFSDPDRPINVLILTGYYVDDAVYAALRAGATGLLLKDNAPGQLIPAIRTVAAGDAWLDPSVARDLLREFAARPERSHPTPRELARLTAREREVLVLVAHGMSNSQIAKHLYIGEATVKTHVGRVLMKLGLDNRAQATGAAYQTGLVVRGSGPPPPRTRTP